jgi:hypothetical protein
MHRDLVEAVRGMRSPEIVPVRGGDRVGGRFSDTIEAKSPPTPSLLRNQNVEASRKPDSVAVRGILASHDNAVGVHRGCENVGNSETEPRRGRGRARVPPGSRIKAVKDGQAI